MRIWEGAIRRPVLTTAVALWVVAAGIAACWRLERALWPAATLPFCTITTVLPGASPAAIEAQVTEVIEARVAPVLGVQRLASQSREHASVVMVQFDTDTRFDEALARLRDALGGARGALPAAAQPPELAHFDIGQLPVLVVALPRGPGGLDAAAAEAVAARLAAVDGVGQITRRGWPAHEVTVRLDPARLRSLGLPPQAALAKIRAEHLDMPLGNGDDTSARLAGAAGSPAELGELVLAAAGGRVIRLADVATISRDEAPAREATRLGGKPAWVLEVGRRPGTDTASLCRALRDQLAGVPAEVVVDQGREIGPSLRELALALAFGGLMAALVVWFFLADTRGMLVTALALPTSVLGTLAVMWAAGFSLNQVTLLSLSLAIGLLIDDAVVVRESIARRLAGGADPFEAARAGTAEVALAVTATTLTLAAVFAPLALMRGLAAQFFRQFGVTMAVAVLLSLVVALTVDPMLSARLTRPRRRQTAGIAAAIERLLAAGERAYAAVLAPCLAHPRAVVAGAAVLVAGLLAVGRAVGTEFLASQDRGQLTVDIVHPAGTTVADGERRLAPLHDRVRGLPAVRQIYAHIGALSEPEHVSWRVLLAPAAARPGGLAAAKAAVEQALASLPEHSPGARATVSEPPLLEGVGAWPPVVVRLTGPALAPLESQAARLGEQIASLPGAAQVQAWIRPSRAELVVEPQRQALAQAGLTSYELGAQLRLADAGEVVGQLAVDGAALPLRVRVGETPRAAAAWAELPVWTGAGPRALAALATVSSRAAPAVIDREARQRQVSVTAELAAGADLGAVDRQVRGLVRDLDLPPGAHATFSGQQQDMQGMVASTLWALGFAFLLVYVILAAQFESWRHPFTIMLSVPLALVGAVAALALGRFTVSMGSCIGVILLVGLVLKNSILLVACAQDLRADGLAPRAAMAAAGPRRLRPILMTSLAMVLGMLPAALSTGAGWEFRGPMAWVVIAGVTTSTILTLAVVPAVFVLLEPEKARA